MDKNSNSHLIGMKKLTTVLVFIFLFSGAGTVNANWIKSFGTTAGDDYGHCVRQTNDGGFIVTGEIEIGYLIDIWLIKINPYGDTSWTKAFGGADKDDSYSYSVEQTYDGGYIIAGYTEAFGAGKSDAWLIKTDANGDTLWTKTFGDTSLDVAYSARQTPDSGYILTGATYPAGSASCDLWLIKTDKNGIPAWMKTYGYSSKNEAGYSVRQTADGGYIIVGGTKACTAQLGIWLLKTDSNGDTMWTKTYIDLDWNMGFSVEQTTDGGYIIAGKKEFYADSISSFNSAMWIIKTNSSGDTSWTRTFYGVIREDNLECSAQQTADGGYIIAGDKKIDGGSSHNFDVLLAKTDANGDTMWTRTFGGPYDDGGASVRQTSDKGYVVSGIINPNDDDYDALVIKTDSLGNIGIKENPKSPTPNPKLTISQNPIRNNTVIHYSLPYRSVISLKIHDLTGRDVRTFVQGEKQAGNYVFKWDAKGWAAGIYFITLNTGNCSITKKLALIN